MSLRTCSRHAYPRRSRKVLDSSDLAFLSLTEAGDLVRRRELSPVEYVEALLARAEELEPGLSSFIRMMPDDALAAARAAAAEIQAGGWKGPLHGMPYALKDNIDYAGVPTTAHSRILAGNVADSDAFVTSRLRGAGAVCLGKLALHEFAIGGPSFDLPWPPARNPWNPRHHPGGSSSGSGAAVAAGLVPAALGTDTAGSVRNPASMCGIVGMKPTYGLVSRAGVVPLSFSLDHVGPMTRTVEDNAILLGVVAGHDAADPGSADTAAVDYRSSLRRGIKGTRIGYVRHFHDVDVAGADAEMVASLDAAAELLRDCGADVDELVLEPLAQYESVQRVIQMAEAYSVHQRWLRDRPGEYGALGRRRLLAGAFISGGDYVTAARHRRRMVDAFAAATTDLDAVICASSMEPAAEISDADEVARTYPRQARLVFNLLGNPALALPTGFSTSGLPLAMQIVGKPFAESTVLRVAFAYEQAAGWTSRRPSCSVDPPYPHVSKHPTRG
jgi:aspartyl-tRNA(Asn)/glutamyl-tRNA(Gln) amidotransferase subunit A